jgi:Ser/Thr protein kinase RdoA (MazF antagonist)
VRSEAEPAFVETQVEVLRYLAEPCPGARSGGPSGRAEPAALSTPEVVLSLDGAAIEEAWADDERHLVWLVRFIPGRPLAEARPHRPELLASFGCGLGELDLRLAPFSHAAVHRYLPWDLRNALGVRPLLEHVEPPARRELVAAHLDRAEEEVLPRLRETRAQLIHNDANDYNVLVDTSGTALTGILDFGDMVHTHLVCEPAVAMAYLMMNDADPISAARHFMVGYQSACPLTEAEILLLPDLIFTRLCMSVVLSAHRKRSRPENAYLTISEASAWRLLDVLGTLDVDEVGAELARACTRTNG